MTSARMKNPALLLPQANDGIQTVIKSVYAAGVPKEILELVHLRASQINGCTFCVMMGAESAKTTPERLIKMIAVSAWTDSPLFDEAERAALELTEAITRLADRPASVTDEIYQAAAKHFDEKQLAAVILMISLTNLFNRVNTTIRQPPGNPFG